MNSKPSILVLEDEAMTARELASVLTEFGYTVLGPAQTGAQAAALAAEQTPDLLVASVGGQREDGFALGVSLRERFGVPALYLAEGSEPLIQERALSAAAFGFLTKPVRAADLRVAVALALSHSKLEQSLNQRLRELGAAALRPSAEWGDTSASEARYRALFDASPDALLLVDRGARISMVNASAQRLLSVDHTGLIGHDLKELIPDPLFRKLLGTAVPAVGVRAATRGPSGEEVLLELALSPLTLEGTRFLLVVARDVSEQERRESQREKLRTLEALGRLAAGVAHDVNNMVTVTLSLAGALKTKLSDRPEVAPLLRDLRDAGQRAALLTRQLLTFAKRLPANAQSVSLNEEISAFSRLLTRAIAPHASLKLELDDDRCSAFIDPAHLQQVLLNLVVNARDAMPEGGEVRLRTRANQTSPSGGSCSLIEVQDAGCGMDQETQSRLFEPLFTTKSAGEGTGLGLSTVYGLVAQAGGDIAVDSRVGHGTMFRIWLPQHSEWVPRGTPVTRA